MAWPDECYGLARPRLMPVVGLLVVIPLPAPLLRLKEQRWSSELRMARGLKTFQSLTPPLCRCSTGANCNVGELATASCRWIRWFYSSRAVSGSNTVGAFLACSYWC